MDFKKNNPVREKHIMSEEIVEAREREFLLRENMMLL